MQKRNLRCGGGSFILWGGILPQNLVSMQGKTPSHTPQISFAYSRTVRSAENRPAEAVQISPRLA